MNRTPEGRRVLVADPSPLLRDGICSAIERDGCFSIAGQAGSAVEIRDAIQRDGPDIVTLCLEIGATDGLELIKTLRAEAPALRILVVTSLDEDPWALRALGAGADGYVSKTADAAVMLEALHAVAAGDAWLSPRMTSRLVRRVCGKEAADGRGSVDILSDRELHVFRSIGCGLGTRQIAEALHLSVKTIETYRANIRVKLGLRDASETVARAREWVERMGSPVAPRPLDLR